MLLAKIKFSFTRYSIGFLFACFFQFLYSLDTLSDYGVLKRVVEERENGKVQRRVIDTRVFNFFFVFILFPPFSGTIVM